MYLNGSNTAIASLDIWADLWFCMWLAVLHGFFHYERLPARESARAWAEFEVDANYCASYYFEHANSDNFANDISSSHFRSDSFANNSQCCASRPAEVSTGRIHVL